MCFLDLVDVTLRDGGHQVNFDWPIEIARDLIHSLGATQVKFVELGYWRQTGKFSGGFYNFGPGLLEELVSVKPENIKFAMMVDHHYCPKELSVYPEVKDGLDLMRITARKEEIEAAARFAQDLREVSGCRTSVNIFNVTNYDDEEIKRALDLLAVDPPDFVYFADTHGALNLDYEQERFGLYAEAIKQFGSIPGFHLHNHSGKAMSNFELLPSLGFEVADASLNGLGKGLGNLKLEEVLSTTESLDVLDVWRRFPRWFSMPQNPFGIIGASASVTDNYAEQALLSGMSTREFFSRISHLTGTDKDNFKKDFLTGGSH